MANYWQKQPSSRPIKTTTLTSGMSASSPTTNFTSQTYQIRVAGNVGGYLVIGYGNAVTATQLTGMVIAANVAGEYLAVNAGQMAAFISTSTSTVAAVTITEMS